MFQTDCGTHAVDVGRLYRGDIIALYVVHGLLTATWLGSGDDLVKYLKRPLLLAATFGLAHLSTFYFEARFIAWGKRLSNPRRPTPAQRSVDQP